MSDKISSSPLAQSFFILVICAVGVLAFFVLIILPSKKNSADLDRDIESLTVRIEEQRILTPVFHSLLKRAKMEGPSGLPSPKKSKLTHGDMNAIPKVFQDFAGRRSLKVEEITTDDSSLTQESGYLLMRLRLSGDFFKIREFLIDIGSIPSLEHIEEINIRSLKTSKEIRLKIWLAKE
jgi:Tfp pilus assembly protein PilO